MTTSPFGTPSPFGGTATLERDAAQAGPDAPSAPAAEVKASRGKLLYVLLGVVLLAALGAGAYFLLFAGSEEPEAVVATPPAAAPVEEEVVEPGLPVSQFDELAGRNPFAALVTEGGEAAAPTAPVVAAAPTTPTSTSSGSTSGSSGSTAGAAGADGADGVDGIDGVDGVDGKDGVDGVDGAPGARPVWTTLTLRDITDDATPSPSATFTVRDASTEFTTAGVVVGDQVAEVGATEVQPVLVLSYEDVDADGELDYAIVEVAGPTPETTSTFSVWIGEATPLFGY